MNGKKKAGHFGNHIVDGQSCTQPLERKKRGRIRYQGWVKDICSVWNHGINEASPPDHSTKTFSPEACDSINREVRKAVAKLRPDERRFVEMFYFEFNSYREIARRLDRKTHKLERIHQRAIGKLRLLLAGFVKEHFGLDVEQNTDCIICSSSHREEMDRLINTKKEEETYSSLIKRFKQKYGIEIKTPQVLIGHRRKHMI
jgi:RNA polymerase sigma factor (sigma-70 family)